MMTISEWIRNLHVEITGPADRDPLLLLHGWGSNAGLMRPLASAFQQNFRVFNVDLPGHGQTPPPPAAWGVPEHAELIDAFLKEYVQKPVHLIGHSNGGRIGLFMAGDPAFAGRVRTLALVSPSGVKPIRKLKYYLRKGITSTLKAPFQWLPARLKDYGLDWLRHSLVWRLLGSSDYSQLHGVMREVFVKTVNCYVEDRLPNVAAPTLLFWGTRDDAVSRHQMLVMERAIPDCTLIELENASHYGYLDQPAVVVSAIRKFYQSPGSGVRGPGSRLSNVERRVSSVEDSESHRTKLNTRQSTIDNRHSTLDNRHSPDP